MSDRLPVPVPDRNLAAGLPTSSADEESMRGLICHVGRLLHEAGLIQGTAGSISLRLSANFLLATPPGYAKGFLQPEHILRIVFSPERPGNPWQTDTALARDLDAHVECYRSRPDVRAVIQAQPPIAVALTLAGVTMRSCVVPEAIVLLGLTPTAAYSPPGSESLREAVRVLSAAHDALLIAHQGALTLGPDLWQAYLRMEVLEHTASVLHRAAQLGPIQTLSPEQVAPLLELRRQLGYWHPGDEDRFCEMCGVCGEED
ncbi:MAG: class II aldolase/adducin family protein [Anaerolineae bacterium]|nr:class II aldolase/adducin family protein [Anaerolineae bacterium]